MKTLIELSKEGKFYPLLEWNKPISLGKGEVTNMLILVLLDSDSDWWRFRKAVLHFHKKETSETKNKNKIAKQKQNKTEILSITAPTTI